MPQNRTQILKELVPGLNAIFGMEYKRYENEHEVLFDKETSDRAYEEDLLVGGFGNAVVKPEGAPITYAASPQEGWLARYHHETVAFGFSITEEAMEDHLYDSLAARNSKSLGRAMSNTKQIKAANVYNNAFSSSYLGGDSQPLVDNDHPLLTGGTWSNRPTTYADLSETSLETAIIDIAGIVDDDGNPIALQPRTLHIPRQLIFVVERLLKTPGRPGTSDNDINALRSMNSIPGGWFVNHRFTDTDAWFIRTDCPDGMKFFTRVPVSTKMEGDFETGNVRYKARERYSFGWTNPRAVYGNQGA